MKLNLTYEFGGKLKKLRKSRYEENPKHFNFCRTQATFAEKFGCERETVLNWEKNNTSPSLSDFIEICKKLECEPNYLLSESNIKSQAIDFISQTLGISIISAERIAQNTFLALLLNHFIESPEFIQLTTNIQEFIISKFISTETIHTAFNSNFIVEIESIFNKFYFETFPLERNVENFQLYLRKKIPFKSCINNKNSKNNLDALDTYLKEKLSQDTYRQIYLQYEDSNIKSAEILYDIFITDTVSRTYDILLDRYIRDIKLNQITQTITNLLINFQYKMPHNNK